MGLENLKSVFANLPNTPSVSPDNSSMSPTLEKKGRHGDNSHPGNHSILDEFELNKKTKIEFTTDLNDITKNSTDPISNINSPVSDLSKDASSYGQHSPITKIDSIFANKSIRLKGGESLIDTEIEHTFGTKGEHSDIKELSPITFRQEDSPQTKQERIIINDKKIREREDYLFQNLGADDKLGQGSFIFDSLYNADQTAPDISDRTPIDIGRVDHLGNPILINTARTGMGALSNLDIYNSSRQGFRIGINGSKEPYIVNDIGSSQMPLGHNRDVLPYQATLQDASRLLKFYTSGAGVASLLKENVTGAYFSSLGTISPNNWWDGHPGSVEFGKGYMGYLIGLGKKTIMKGVLEIANPATPRLLAGAIHAPTVPFPLTGMLNFYGLAGQSPGIPSLRKPFVLEYGKVVKSGKEEFSKVKLLGDIKEKGQLFSVGGRKFRDSMGVLRSRNPVTDEVLKEDPTSLLTYHITPPPFMGLGESPKYTVDDKISKSGLINRKITDAINPLDFYVRIKDLRNGNFIYFRGYVTGITENANPSWTSQNYIGRSEPVYMYERGERDLSFNLRLSPANKTEFQKMWEKINQLTSLVYPEYLEKDNMTRMKPPFTELYMAQFGSNAQGQFGFVKSISYTVNDSGDWDADTQKPRLIDVAISYQILNKKPPSLYSNEDTTTLTKFYNY